MKKLITILLIVCAFQGFAQTMKINKNIQNVTVDIILDEEFDVTNKANELDFTITFYYDMVIYLHSAEIARTRKLMDIPMDKTKDKEYHKTIFWNQIKAFLMLEEGEYTILNN